MQQKPKIPKRKGFTWWDYELKTFERKDAEHAWDELLADGKVEVGSDASVTDNLSAVLDFMLKCNPSYYKGKLDADHCGSQIKYGQLYHKIHYLTKEKKIAQVSSDPNEASLNNPEDDEAFLSVAQSTASKDPPNVLADQQFLSS